MSRPSQLPPRHLALRRPPNPYPRNPISTHCSNAGHSIHFTLPPRRRRRPQPVTPRQLTDGSDNVVGQPPAAARRGGHRIGDPVPRRRPAVEAVQCGPVGVKTGRCHPPVIADYAPYVTPLTDSLVKPRNPHLRRLPRLQASDLPRILRRPPQPDPRPADPASRPPPDRGPALGRRQGRRTRPRRRQGSRQLGVRRQHARGGIPASAARHRRRRPRCPRRDRAARDRAGRRLRLGRPRPRHWH
jgi:hypothetical protein